MTPFPDLVPALPELVVLAAAVVITMVGVFRRGRGRIERGVTGAPAQPSHSPWFRVDPGKGMES